MSNSKFLSLDGLVDFLNQQNVVGAKEFLDNVTNFFDNQLTKAELDLALEVIFNDTIGTLAFIKKSIRAAKRFQASNIVILNLWIKILEDHGKDTSFDLYVDNIIEVCQKYVISTEVSAKEKERATVVLQEVFRNKIVENRDMSGLVSRLLDVFNIKKRPVNFTQQVFRLLGIISRDAPENVIGDNAILIRDVILKTLEETLLNEEGIENNVLTGAMEGLNAYVINFAPSPDDEQHYCQRIYACVKKLSSPPEYVRHKAPFRAALDVFTSHCNLFSNQIYNDFKFWNDTLVKWMSSAVYDDRRKGMYAMHSFHKMVSEGIKQECKNAEEILKYLIIYFRSILESPNSGAHETRIAIRGFGLLSASCQKYWKSVANEMLSLVIQRTELISIAEDNEMRESLEHFPDYIQAISQMILDVDDIKIIQALSHIIKNIVVRFVKDFHYLSRAHTGLAVNALCSSFFNLMEANGSLFEDVIEKVIFQGVIWTCSHKIAYEAAGDWSTDINWKDNLTYMNIMPLWEGLLDENMHSTFNKPQISRSIFNHLLSSLFVILEKLDLSTKRRVYIDESGLDKEFFFCDPNIDLCPVRPKDFYIFFNITDFYCAIFRTKYRREYFRDWIDEYCTNMIRYAVKNPLVSGFLRLVEHGLNIAEYLKYFESDSISDTDELRAELSYFLKSIIIKSQSVSGELQMSCLELILKFPPHFFGEYIKYLEPVFASAFDLGKSMTWLAKLAINCLDKICDTYQESIYDLRKFYQQVLPNLDSYLQSTGSFDDMNVQIFNYKNRKRIQKGVTKKIGDAELLSVQKKILSFLGKLDPEDAALVVSRHDQDLVKWDANQIIRLTLYFPDMRPDIYLDCLVPRICHLAIMSTDRKVKIAACEFVHTLVLYLLGTKKHSGKIWGELCTRMIILGSDGDATVQQMFEPLLMQVMHFMSRYENLNLGVDTLMNALMDGISNSSNCSIRDLSALCLREFVEWSIKQTTPAQLAASPVSIQIILAQLKIYSIDCNAARRSGAALAFNNLYRNLREEESICDMFFVDLLHTFCINYRLTEDLSNVPLGDLNSDLEIVSMSLDHIIRVLKERNYLYNAKGQKRTVPPAMGEGTLKDIVLFLLTECGSKLMNYRHKCVQMIHTLVRKIENVSSLTMFLTRFADNKMLQTICEGGPDGNGICTRPDLTYLKHSNSIPQLLVYNWLEHFLTALDNYTWLMSDTGVQDPKIIFDNSKIFQVLSYYLANISWSTIYEIIERLNENFLNETSSTAIRVGKEEHNRIDSIKCIITVRILDFLAMVIKTDCRDQIPDKFWWDNTQALTNLVVQIIFEPQKLNFDFRSEEVSKNLPERLQNYLRYLQKHNGAKPAINALHQQLVRIFSHHINEICESAQAYLSSERILQKYKNIVRGILFVVKDLNILLNTETINMFLKTTVKNLCHNLFEGITQKIFDRDITVQPTPEVKKFANNLLRICFATNFDGMPKTVAEMLLNRNVLTLQGTSSEITHGEHFFNIYKTALLENLKNGTLTDICTNIFDGINSDNYHFIIKILIEISIYIQKYYRSDKDTLQAFTKVCMLNISQILSHFQDTDNDILLYELMTQFGLLQIQKSSSFDTVALELEVWIIQRMVNPKCSLELKSRAMTMLALVLNSEIVENKSITDALEEMQRQHFPLKSTEFTKNSLEETSFKLAFNSLISALVNTQSFVLVEFLIKCTATDSKHLLEYVIRDELKVFAVSLPSERQVIVLSRVFEIVMNETYDPSIRYTILERFLYNLLQNSSVEAVMEFATNNIVRISALTESSYTSGNSDWEVEHALVNRIVGFSMVELIFGMLPKEKYARKESSIAIALLKTPSSDNEMIGNLTKKAFYVRTEVFSNESPSAAEYFRLYQCAAYRAICSLVSNTQLEIRYYSKFLFEENPTKREFIWRNLIDCRPEKTYIFQGQEFERYPRTKERFVAIRKLNVVPNACQKLYQSSRQLQTQNIFESSLNADVNKIDMNYSSVRTNTEVLSRMEEISRENISVHLERHELNKHEIMPTICGVIQHMQENAITPLIVDINMKRTYPWISAIAGTIGNVEAHKNIRIFLAQLVDNCRNVFDSYAHVLYQPFLAMLVDECAGNELNFFITDMIALLLSWTAKGLHSPKSSEEMSLASDLLKFLMRKAWTDKKELLKFNLELVQTIINMWKDVIAVPTQLLYEMITRSKKDDSKANEPGLVFLGIILTFEQIPWSDRLKTPFIRAVLVNLTNDYSSVYQPAAHVAGMILATLRRIRDNETADSVHDEIVLILKTLLSKRDNKKEKIFRDVLYGVHKMHPPILEAFGEIIPFKIPSAIGPIKTMYLEMFLSRVDLYESEEMFTILISIGMKSLFKQTDHHQLLGLHILNKSLAKLKDSEIASFFPIIEECLHSKKDDCRQVSYEILICLLNTRESEELKSKSSVLLLKGLADIDSNIKKRIFQFWSQEVFLMTETTTKITSLIRDYAINSEKEFLGFCVQLIIESAVQEADSKRQIFAFETDKDSKLLEYKISTHSRIRNSFTLPPLFAETQIFRQSLLSGTQKCNFVRATGGDYFFEPTQDPGAIARTSENFTLQTQGSLPFSLSTQILDRRSKKIGQGLAAKKSKDGDANEMNLFRQRFLIDKDKEKRENVLKIIDFKTRQIKRAAGELKAKEGQVALYRRYRFGDYPDLLINSLAFLLPLQGVAQRDPIVARQLFVSMFSTIVSQLGSEAKSFMGLVGEGIENILCNSKACDPTIFATFLEIALMRPKNFNISPSTVALMAKATNKLTIGAIYLEHRLNAECDDDTSSVRSSSSISSEDMYWLQLSDIYTHLKEYDIVASIFSDKIQTDPRLAQAIELKANGQYHEAQKLLTTVIDRGVQIEQYYAYNCYYECFMDLGDWSSLSQCISNQLDDPEELWTDEYNTIFVLPKLVQSELQLILEGDARSRTFLGTIENWIKDPIKREHIQSAFCEELMMLHIANEEYLKARVYCENFLNTFLAEWGVISSLCHKLKLGNLLNAQKVAEIDHYALVLLENFNEQSISRFEKRWNNCKIKSTDSLRFWNSVVVYRIYIVALFSYHLENMNTQSSLSGIQKSVNTMSLQIFNAAVEQQNIGLAKSYLQRIYPPEGSEDQNQHFIYDLARIKYELLQGQQSTNRMDKINIMKQAWQSTAESVTNERLKSVPRVYLEAVSLNAKIGEQLFKEVQKGGIDADTETSLKALAHNSQAASVQQRIFEHSLHSLQAAVNFSTGYLTESEQTENEMKDIADSYYNLAQFCYDHVGNRKLNISEDIEKTIINAVFQAMRYNSTEAMQLFACILQLPSLENGKLRKYFEENSIGVPEWMFLQWIPQIMSRFELEQRCYLDNIVQRISAVYPNALKYPFNLWFERATDMKNQTNVAVMRREISEIIGNLKNPLTDKFIESFKYLCLPEMLLISHLDEFMKKLGDNINQQRYNNALAKLLRIVYPADSSIQGSAYRERIAKYQLPLEELRTFDFEKDHAKICQTIIQIAGELKTAVKTSKLSVRLDTLSPWLANFQWCGTENFLELPGQYTQNSINKRPIVDDHVKIVKIGDILHGFFSQRCPLRVKFHGSNAKSYDFLIKVGEDLKQDQRIQQILGLMSEKLSEDQNCRNHNLFVRTYKVIPIQSNCGMLSWVQDATALREFIDECFHRRDPNSETILRENVDSYLKFIKEASLSETNRQAWIDVYGKAAMTYSRERIAQNFRTLDHNIPAEVLKYALADIAVSPESFFALRNNFATSLAAMNIANWILGIGDRHLQNILISTKDGSLTGIDFGVTFGSGTRDSSIPELLPFRLTPHLINALNPMSTSGLLSKCMAHSLRVYRNSKKILMACMEVFVREPTVNWLGVGKRIMDQELESNSSVSSIWEPKDRIDIAWAKLEGYNPMHLFERELSVSLIFNKNQDYHQAYLTLLRGKHQFNIRARLPEKHLTVEEQIKCLIDQATDPALLGISYVGFLPWI